MPQTPEVRHGVDDAGRNLCFIANRLAFRPVVIVIVNIPTAGSTDCSVRLKYNAFTLTGFHSGIQGDANICMASCAVLLPEDLRTCRYPFQSALRCPHHPG